VLGVVTALVVPAVAATAAAPTQTAPPNVAPGVCDQYAGDPDAGTPAWAARDANNVSCDYQRHVDAQTSPAFLAKHQQQVALAEARFPATLAEWAAEPNRVHANCCISPQAKVGDPFRTPEEWAAAGRGRHLKFSLINSNGAKLRARLYAPVATTRVKRYPAVTFTPGLQSYNEVNSWFAQGFAEAGYVVLIIDPQGQGDSENCGHTPDGAQTTCPGTDQPDDTRSAIDFILSTPTSPYPWARGVNAAGTPTFNPFWQSVDRKHVGIRGGRRRSTSPRTTRFLRRARRRRPTPPRRSTSVRSTNSRPPASTPCRSRRGRATTTSSVTSPIRPTSRRAATANGSRSTTPSRGSTGT
jgi:hypothetical protein